MHHPALLSMGMFYRLTCKARATAHLLGRTKDQGPSPNLSCTARLPRSHAFRLAHGCSTYDAPASFWQGPGCWFRSGTTSTGVIQSSAHYSSSCVQASVSSREGAGFGKGFYVCLQRVGKRNVTKNVGIQINEDTILWYFIPFS